MPRHAVLYRSTKFDFQDQMVVIHIIVTYVPKNVPFPRGKVDNQSWKSHVGSKNTLIAWKNLGTLSNSDFGYKIR